MSDTGGGHRASAEALIAAFRQASPRSLEVDMVDLWVDHTPEPIRRLPGTYSFLINRTPWLWRLLWYGGQRPATGRLVAGASYAVTRPWIRRYFMDFRPDLVVSVHPLLQEVPLRAARSVGIVAPFATVVTDLASAHATWFYPGVDLCFVASDEARRRALAAGLGAGQVRLHGLPVRPEFVARTTPRPQLRESRGLPAGLPAVLVMGGGEGMGDLGATVRALSDGLAGGPEGPVGQIVVICGRNRRVARELSETTWAVPVRVLGFVDDVADWMAACDCIVTKAGPGTIAEALIRGLPILLSGYVPGQEEGNVPFVVDGGVGAFETDPKAGADIVAAWFGPRRDALQAMSERAKHLARPEATHDIVADLLEMLESVIVS
jgi:1,2-diacylglycerol 3-beta-galactosyltransferase